MHNKGRESNTITIMKKILKKFGFHVEEESETRFDVVCGMEFPAANAKQASEYNGEIYHFCSQSCKNHFDSDPEKYVGT